MSKSFIVAGMHRSATSLVAKALHDQGVDMGKPLLGAHPSNPHGHYEDERVIKLNDESLSKAGGSWSEPPNKLSPLRDKAAKRITSNRGELWGMKDPRCSLTLGLWLPYMGDDPHVIACFRRPEKVARSLSDRDGTDYEVNYRLAMEYNRRLLRNIQDFVGAYDA